MTWHLYFVEDTEHLADAFVVAHSKAQAKRVFVQAVGYDPDDVAAVAKLADVLTNLDEPKVCYRPQDLTLVALSQAALRIVSGDPLVVEVDGKRFRQGPYLGRALAEAAGGMA